MYDSRKISRSPLYSSELVRRTWSNSSAAVEEAVEGARGADASGTDGLSAETRSGTGVTEPGEATAPEAERGGEAGLSGEGESTVNGS